MCGIAGFLGQQPSSPAQLQAMLAALAQRGPDAQQWHGWDSDWQPQQQTPSAAFLHARLSIRDPRPLADQPMRSEDGQLWLIYNGEVYGWEEDAAYLQRQGLPFHTRSDTEFILRAYQHWGMPGLLPKLRGMFAFALLDLRLGKLWLVRDRLGLKPLLYHHSEQGLAFASLLRALLPWLPEQARQLCPQAVDAYLAHRYIPAPMTLLQGVQRLENGHYLQYELQTRRLSKHCYWQAQPASTTATSLEQLYQELDTSIALRTVADRPVGLFLSGGVDSAVVACRLAAQGYQNIKAFTAAFPGSHFDESEAAARTAQKLGLPFQAVKMPAQIEADFAQLVTDLDEPFADPSSLPLWYLAKQATTEVKVVLNGDGGDELFAGYKRYRQHLRRQWRGNWRLPLRPPASLAHKGWPKVATELGLSWLDAYCLRFSGFSPAQRRALQPRLKASPAHYWRMPDLQGLTPLQQLLQLDMANYLPEYILRKADLTTMAQGLEGRSPLLDHQVVQQVLALPPAQRFSQPAKQCLQPLCAPLGADSPFVRPKRGFNPPLTAWLQPLLNVASDLGGSLSRLTKGQIAAAPVQQLVTTYQRGEEHYAEQVLQLLLLDTCLQQLQDALG
ncbi:asparagine synthase (glutamine-hydrolyzing) [Balneatrix alpica]|uniref:asparagine synthase (glutamine-hydrolyzing) n=1 Tax=Balneatrix alpica TaxID=75684 RepID=A0ABV5ZD70_9GAMM|nr:asparagine synthase (glutamine-hydrolyzing) [Balneatrix alpica]